MKSDKIVLNSAKPVSAAIGYFDGVHRGHSAVIAQALQMAQSCSAAPSVITFDMVNYRARNKGAQNIMSDADKQRSIQRLGITQYFAIPFEQVVSLSGETFVRDILQAQFQVVALSCGRDFRFGHNRACGVSELQQYCGNYGIELNLVDAVIEKGGAISSTRIKQALAAGDIQTVSNMLGRPYRVCLLVYEEKHLARTLGFPTLNQRFPAIVAPRFGVYHTKVMLEDSRYDAVSNIGMRPTVASDDAVVLETHILDYSGSLYGRDINVEFVRFLRDERIFRTPSELKEVVERDINTVRMLASGEPAGAISNAASDAFK